MVADDESNLTFFYRMSLEHYGYEGDIFNEPRKTLSILN